jgi:hypothetical protein
MKIVLPEFLPPDFLAGLSDEPITLEVPADPFRKLFEDGRLAAETAELDRRFAAAHQPREKTASLEKVEWDAPLSDRTRLAKRATPENARIEKSANGLWELTYDAGGNLISGREIAT